MFTMILKIGDSEPVDVTLGRKAPGTVEKPANEPKQKKSKARRRATNTK